MAPHTKPAQSAPRTPKKPKHIERLAETIDKLNRDYNLAIEIPDRTLTPRHSERRRKHDAAFARSDKIVYCIRFHCFQNTTVLDKILHAFHLEARAASQKWIRLSDCYDPVPATARPPIAESPGEVLELQEILISVLEKAKPQDREDIPKPRPFARAQSGPAVYTSIEVPKSKRRPPEDTKDSPKRVKASPAVDEEIDEAIADALDKVPSRSRSAKPDLPSAKFVRDNPFSDIKPKPLSNVLPPLRESVYAAASVATSATTSRASLFSAANEPPPSTQETVPAPSYEARIRGPVLSQEPRSSQSQDPFPASSGHLDALNVSFTEHESEVSSRLYTKPPGHVPTPGDSSPGLTTIYSEISGLNDPALYQPILSPSKRSEPVDLQSRLIATWPRFPAWLNRAPFAVAWEITRIALHCGVDLGETLMSYDETWINYNNLWRALLAHPSFAGKAFPERPTTDAWTAGLSGFKSPRGQHVTFTASLVQTKKVKSGPIFSLTMEPIALDQGCRLHRRFGSDRFIELVIPSPNSWETPINNPKISEDVIDWFSSRLHYLAGRQWRAFYSRDAGYKTPQTNVSLGPDPKPIFREKISLFAENGNNFHAAIPMSSMPVETPSELRVKLEVRDMLDWLLQLDCNEHQPYLKLFARIQLGLSKTTPVVVLNRNQIRHQEKDMLSPIGKVMNDGIGRMSPKLAQKIKNVLGLQDIPSAIQGRFGPAKGMWLIDIQDTGDDLWIETWPSQRKWNCDYLDPEHRTLEIKSHAAEPRSASLNIQFLPVLEDRAVDKPGMRKAIGDSLVDELNRELEGQKNAMKYPVQFRQWVNENSIGRKQRLIHNSVPFLAGLPDSNEETMNFLIDGGFEPSKQKFIQDIAWNLRRQKCENLKKKMSIKIPNSAYFYMVIDFWGVLEENEVHLCFSSKFQTESFSDSMLHGCDVLVARSPAHFVSDVQRVKAVFKPELHALKDVIVFSAKGDIPLADKLSGGDYDGDKAWVCWEPAIVSNFVNANVPPSPDLSRYLKKDKTLYEDLVRRHGKVAAVPAMIKQSIAFSVRPSFLGIATNFKERLCYKINSVNNNYALWLSTLLGNLVDQSKQSFEFTADDWKRFRREVLDSHKFRDLDEPAYKSESWSSRGNPAHIIDYLKFSVAKPTIDKELERFHRAMNTRSSSKRELRSLQLSKEDNEEPTAEYWDPDLVTPHDELDKLASTMPVLKKVLKNLRKDLMALEEQWGKSVTMTKDKDELPRRMLEVYELWCAIQPRADEELNPLATAYLKQSFKTEEHTTWALIRASTAFKYWYKRKSTLLWRMAGKQLQHIKAMTTASRDKVPVTVVPHIYAALRPDNKFITQAVSKMKEDGSEYPGLESDGEDFVGDE
ncbi:putative RNA-dependent RNA polymerase SHL2 [Colletotrichum fructicola]|uniref:RNA-dependent RNA polymerase n=1 Tax=Colletotrichum fructicola (strain Nara gc5) TaxID=1213859 RepID=L2FZH6_COLFN|nr:uncharacterized protein CGMCC3_g12652 [Colletotrichum fructicola]KAF4476844.1 putative RNA-dependent RNA polymerase SHL2 [Colletotrichum fructicola Nara gc5]KAE9571260.1 hypothetical protein CGMCC3_g12652 [Colletotrichum fructicola]KAF4427098.1 putative RNA-dependent RNA polymerase SHL2 [Colletotrichum fructicola]KAF4900509.1 putative RNA-dependent RNA polymerase SHL2 [Colletotrichum fructicola]KAF4910058.1 putative RNA-dependent RNA polymerase SHL2 [Colletotrichum fructicola]